MINIELIDKSAFICYQFKEDSIYYGEVIYQNEEGAFFDPKTDSDASSKGKPLRHGFGIQIFGTSYDDFQCKYEGYWDKDRQHGACRCWFPDKSSYEGNMKYNTKEGTGKFIWPNGDEYNGTWRNNRFEGSGTFSHNEGSELSGTFKNNYFMKTNELFINPFLSADEIEQFIKQKKEIDLKKQNNKKQKLSFFEKVQNLDDLAAIIHKSNSNHRIPLIFSSKQLSIGINDVLTKVQTGQTKIWNHFDLRQAYSLKKSNQEKYEQYMLKVKQDLSNVLFKGDTFLLNIDESTAGNYEEVFYPDIRELYNSSSFPSQIWSIEQLNRSEVFKKIIADTENNHKTELAQDYSIAVWSKYKVDEQTDNKKIIEKVERRFSSIIPMARIDLIMLIH